MLHRLSKHHRLVVFAVQTASFVLAGLSAFLLRFDLQIPGSHVPHLVAGICIWVVVKSVIFCLLKLDRGWWRYVSIQDLIAVGAGNLAASAASGAVIYFFGPNGFPRSVYILDAILCFLLTSGYRLGVRMIYDFARDRQTDTGAERALIYGAGDAGVALLREIRQNSSLPYTVVGFLDDDPSKRGLMIQRVKVLGGGEELAGAAVKLDARNVLIAIPSATGAQMTRILRFCAEAKVAHKTVPGMAEVIESKSLSSQIRDVAVEDLLGRQPVKLDHARLAERFENHVVMVTGAAGSIGSELCRQLARFQPSAIVGYEVAETPLFYLEREMRQAFPDVRFIPAIGCVQDMLRLEQVMRGYAPSAVFHAAAYKHVPMMEANVFAAIRNNVFGTYTVAEAAARWGVENFVMISTDKAVRPTSMMGASKRLAELLVRSMQDGGTRYVSVRFGNVLGSSGSVIPIFKQQIAAGGPVTVTHPEMRRYFMTIPEAAQLVLQASTMGHGGEIFVLDMGEPVRIVDLARDLILLSGLTPGEDIEIVYSGVRPGEKLYEELNTLDEEHLPTDHEKIMVFSGDGVPAGSVPASLKGLDRICREQDLAGLVMMLKDLVPEYNPSAEILKRSYETGVVRARAAGAGGSAVETGANSWLSTL